MLLLLAEGQGADGQTRATGQAQQARPDLAAEHRVERVGQQSMGVVVVVVCRSRGAGRPVALWSRVSCCVSSRPPLRHARAAAGSGWLGKLESLFALGLARCMTRT